MLKRNILNKVSSEAATMASDPKGVMTRRCTRRIRAPLDQLVFQPLDQAEEVNSLRTTDVGVISFYFPQQQLINGIHRRYEPEKFGELVPPAEGASTPAAAISEDATMSTDAPPPSGSENPQQQRQQQPVPLSIVTLLLGRNYPTHQSLLERWIDPAPHVNLSVFVSCVDRIHWQRAQWFAGGICKSLCWGRIPHHVYGAPIIYNQKVELDTVFDPIQNRFTKYRCAVPSFDFEIELEDLNVPVLDRSVPVVEGFLDNESALKHFALNRESIMRGIGGSVYRQTLWSSPAMPNHGRVASFKEGGLFQYFLNSKSPIGPPLHAWLLNEVSTTKIYKIEACVESENDPHNASHTLGKTIQTRVQTKAMGRYDTFKDELRAKAYADLNESEIPR